VPRKLTEPADRPGRGLSDCTVAFDESPYTHRKNVRKNENASLTILIVQQAPTPGRRKRKIFHFSFIAMQVREKLILIIAGWDLHFFWSPLINPRRQTAIAT
jgi:hypothetical protein